MRLAILGSRGIPALYGGFETFAEELSSRLVKDGDEVTVYCEMKEGEQPKTHQGVNLVHIPAPKLGPFTTILFDLLCLWHARKAFDVVYMLGYGTSIFCFIPRLWGTTVLINMDGVEWARDKWGRLAKLWFKVMESVAMWTPDQLIADAEGILKHLQSRHTHLPPVSVIPYGAPVVDKAPNINLLDEWQLTRDRYYLVVCRLEPENSVLEIVKGYLQSESGHHLVVVGCKKHPTEYVKELLLLSNSRIHFIGTLYDREKLQALRYHAFAYFHGHTVGGTNPSLLEALGCGSVIIAHNNIFNQEVAERSAIYFQRGQDVAKCIRTVEAYPEELRNQLKCMARDRIRQVYSWDVIMESYRNVLSHPHIEVEKRKFKRVQAGNISEPKVIRTT